MLLSDKRIKEEMEKGNIVIEPFDPRQLGSNSYDVRIGENYYAQTRKMDGLIINDEEQVREFWGDVRIGNRYIPVRPGETILAHTIEVIGGQNTITTSMRARSSIGRSCLSIAKCAGVGDVGYISRWTMEVSNHSHVILYIPIGMRVGQIEFYEVGDTDKKYSGKYGQGEWSPEDMLPKLWKDKF
jgi:dCTP deaminase